MIRLTFVVLTPALTRVTVTFRDDPKDDAFKAAAIDLIRQALRTLYGGPIVQTDEERAAAEKRAQQKWFA